jgi:hypothetical protein
MMNTDHEDREAGFFVSFAIFVVILAFERNRYGF